MIESSSFRSVFVRVFNTQEEYNLYHYRRELRRTANGMGIFLLISFLLEIVLSVVTLVVRSIGTPYAELIEDTLGTMIESGLISTLIFFFVSLVYAIIKRADFSALFPFCKTSAGTIALFVIVGLTVTLMANYVSDMVTAVFGMFGADNSVEMSYAVDSPLSVILYFFTVAVIPALVEEFAFRGVILGSLRKYSDALAVVVSAGLFALMHGNFVQIPFAFIGGLVFGFVVVKTNSLLPSIIIHFLNNGLSVLLDVLSNNGDGAFYGTNLFWNLLLLLLVLVSAVLIAVITRRKPELLRFSDSDNVIAYRQKLGTVCSSPGIIAFAAVMLVYAVYVLMGV